MIKQKHTGDCEFQKHQKTFISNIFPYKTKNVNMIILAYRFCWSYTLFSGQNKEYVTLLRDSDNVKVLFYDLKAEFKT